MSGRVVGGVEEARSSTPASAHRLAICRVVTTCASARLLLSGQFEAMPDVDWTVVAGDRCAGVPTNVATATIPMRRDPAVSDLRAGSRLFMFFRRRRFDLVQTHTPKASLLGLPAARLAGRRTVYTMHGALYFRENGVLRNLAGWAFERWCCSWAHWVLVQSREDEAAIVRSRCCPARKVMYVGNGISLERFPVAPAPSGPPTVLMVSRLVAEKGCLDFFRLARELRSLARFVHVGPVEHDQQDAISERDRQAAVEAGVQFVGEVDDVRPHLAAAHVIVLPSFREGIPRAAMEAAATGRPVVAYDIRGVREVVPPELGLLVPKGDVPALAQAVRRLLSSADEREQAGRQCSEWVRARFSEHDVVHRLRRAYARALES